MKDVYSIATVALTSATLGEVVEKLATASEEQLRRCQDEDDVEAGRTNELEGSAAYRSREIALDSERSGAKMPQTLLRNGASTNGATMKAIRMLVTARLKSVKRDIKS